MRKLLVFVAIFLLLLGGLVYLNTYKAKEGDNIAAVAGTAEPITTQAQPIAPAFNHADSNLVSVTLEANKATLAFVEKDDQWIADGYKDVSLNQQNMVMFARDFAQLDVSGTVEKKLIDSAYGLDVPSAVARLTFDNGETETLHLGNATPDGQYYYMRADGNDTIYLLDALHGQRFLYTLDDVIEKDLPTISANEPMLVHIVQKGKDEILIQFEGSKGKDAEKMAGYGMYTMMMKKPIDGVLVYPTNLATYVLSDLSSLKFTSLVEASCADMGKYGLSTPFLDVDLADADHAVHLLFGDKADEDSYYCRKADDTNVFKIDASAVKPFVDVDIYKFIERFVSLVYKDTLQSATVTAGQASYVLTFEKNGKTEKDTKNFVNGTEVSGERFNPAYELLTGLSFDKVSYDLEASYFQKTPILLVTYHFQDTAMPDTVCKYYDYNANFYVAEKDGKGIYIVNKQSVADMLRGLDGLVQH